MEFAAQLQAFKKVLEKQAQNWTERKLFRNKFCKMKIRIFYQIFTKQKARKVNKRKAVETCLRNKILFSQTILRNKRKIPRNNPTGHSCVQKCSPCSAKVKIGEGTALACSGLQTWKLNLQKWRYWWKGNGGRVEKMVLGNSRDQVNLTLSGCVRFGVLEVRLWGTLVNCVAACERLCATAK